MCVTKNGKEGCIERKKRNKKMKWPLEKERQIEVAQ